MWISKKEYKILKENAEKNIDVKCKKWLGKVVNYR